MTRTFLYKFVEVHKSANAYGIAVRNSVLEIIVYYYVVSTKICSWNWENWEVFEEEFSPLHLTSALKKTQDFSASTSETGENVYLFNLVSNLYPLEYTYSISLMLWEQTSSKKFLLEFIKKRSRVHDNNTSRELGLNFDQWKTFSENYKLIRIWLMFV